jgi:xanthine/uracil permease
MEKIKLSLISKIVMVVWLLIMVVVGFYGIWTHHLSWLPLSLIGAMTLLMCLIVKVQIEMNREIKEIKKKIDNR